MNECYEYLYYPPIPNYPPCTLQYILTYLFPYIDNESILYNI